VPHIDINLAYLCWTPFNIRFSVCLGKICDRPFTKSQMRQSGIKHNHLLLDKHLGRLKDQGFLSETSAGRPSTVRWQLGSTLMPHNHYIFLDKNLERLKEDQRLGVSYC
jgi:hypothetical protein